MTVRTHVNHLTFLVILLSLGGLSLASEEASDPPAAAIPGILGTTHEVNTDFRVTFIWLDAQAINAHTQQGLDFLNPLMGHGLSISGDAAPLLLGTLQMGAHILGAYETNASKQGGDAYGLATGGYWAGIRWRFFGFLDAQVRAGLTCGLIFLGSGPSTYYFTGYLGFEPAVSLAVNLWIFRIEAGFVYGLPIPVNAYSWMQPGGPRLEIGLGIRY